MSSGYQKAIELAGSGKKFPVMQLVRQDPTMAATLAKLIPSQHPVEHGDDGNRKPATPNLYSFRNAAEQTAQNVNDAETVMQLLPDMELAQQILVSSVGSPKDMMSLELTYTAPEGLTAPDVSSAMIDRYRQHFEQVHKIKPLIPKILRDMLFRTGSYSLAVIPENSVDEVINGQVRPSMENLSEHINPDGSVRPIGILGPSSRTMPTEESSRRPGLAVESFNDYNFNADPTQGLMRFEHGLSKALEADDVFVTVTDNPTVLKIPQINQKLREQRIFSAMGSRAMESLGMTDKNPLHAMNDRELTGQLYRNRKYGYQPVASLKTQDQLNRRTVGNPMVMHIPSESVIPVHVPGTPQNQIGFFVLLDEDGHPIVRQQITDHYQQMAQRMSTSGNFPSAMLNKVKTQMNGFDIYNRDHLDYSARVYGDMVEQDLLSRLRNGAYGNSVEIGKNEEIYRIMFSRALARQHTQLLFIPAEFMTYFAMRYNQDGIGESLLDEMKILNSLRSMLLFANVMAGIKNSIGRTEVKVKFDEDDPNPEKTLETSIHEIIRSRQNFLPLGVNSPAEVMDFITRAGYEFTYEGHPGMPDVAIDFGEKNSNYTKPDTELEDNLRKRAIMKTGVPPETIDAAYQPELATSVVTNNILLSKRVMQIQDEFHPLLAQHMRQHAMNSQDLMGDLRDILRENFKKIVLEKEDKQDARINETSHRARYMRDGTPILDESMPAHGKGKGKDDSSSKLSEQEKEYIINQVLIDFIMNIEVSLPRPNSSTLANQFEAMKNYSEALDQGLEAWVSDTFFTPDTAGDVAEKINTMKGVAKAYFLRKWMADNGMLNELAQLTTTDEEGKPVIDIFKLQADHIETLQKTFNEFFKGLVSITNKENDTYQATMKESNTQAEGSNTSFGDNGSSDLGGGGMGDLGGGGGDSGGLGDLGGPDLGGAPDLGTGGGEGGSDLSSLGGTSNGSTQELDQMGEGPDLSEGAQAVDDVGKNGLGGSGPTENAVEAPEGPDEAEHPDLAPRPGPDEMTHAGDITGDTPQAPKETQGESANANEKKEGEKKDEEDKDKKDKSAPSGGF
jgi:hypothetical protein